MYLTKFVSKNVDFLFQLFEEGNLKPWDDLELKYNLTNETCFQWLQLKHAIPHNLKTSIEQNPGNVSNHVIQDHHKTMVTLEKLFSKELYLVLITKFTYKPSSNVYFEKIFSNIKLNWRKIYISLHITFINTYLCSFQYKILNSILFLNNKLFK